MCQMIFCVLDVHKLIASSQESLTGNAYWLQNHRAGRWLRGHLNPDTSQLHCTACVLNHSAKLANGRRPPTFS